jgi:hypothetical protein
MVLRGQLWTLAQLNSRLDTAIDDSSDLRWSSAQKDTAIKTAILSVGPKWLEERIDDTNTYSDDTYRYNMPPACYRVISLAFSDPNDGMRYSVNPTTWHVEGSEIVFTYEYEKYDGETMYILYHVLPSNLLTLSMTTAAVASIITKALTCAGETFITKGVLVGDPVIINEGSYAGNGTYYVASVDSETQVTLHKAPGTIGTNLDCTIAQYTDLPIDYVIAKSKAELYMLTVMNAPGQEIDTNIKLASYHEQLANAILQKRERRSNPSRSY